MTTAETTRKSKRQVPSWGITKADLMRMHGEEVAKLKARIAALENPSESRKSLAAKRTLMDSIWADEIGSKGMVMLFLHDLTDKGLVKSEMKPKGKSLVRVWTALDNSSESLTGRAEKEGSGNAGTRLEPHKPEPKDAFTTPSSPRPDSGLTGLKEAVVKMVDETEIRGTAYGKKASLPRYHRKTLLAVLQLIKEREQASK